MAEGGSVVGAVAFDPGTVIKGRGAITSDAAANVAANIPSIVGPNSPPPEYCIDCSSFRRICNRYGGVSLWLCLDDSNY